MHSIRVSLLKRLLLPLLIINLVGAGFTYWLAWRPTQIAYDQNLADAAWALLPTLQQRLPTMRPRPLPAASDRADPRV